MRMKIRLLTYLMVAPVGAAFGELEPDNPYLSIVEANVFRLEEPAAPPPAPEPSTALPEVEPEDLDLTLTGFGRFGDIDVVFFMGEDKKDNNRRKYYSVKVTKERSSPIDVLDYDKENQSVTLMYQGRKMALNMEEHGNKPGGSRPGRAANPARTQGGQANGAQANAGQAAPRGPLVIGGRNGNSNASSPAGAQNANAANSRVGATTGATRNANNAAGRVGGAVGRAVPQRRTRVVGSTDSGFETPEAQAASAIISAEQIRQNTGIAIPMPPGLDIMGGNTTQSAPGGQ